MNIQEKSQILLERIKQQQKIYRKRLSKNIRERRDNPNSCEHKKSKLEADAELQNNHQKLQRLKTLRERCIKLIERKTPQQARQNRTSANERSTTQQGEANPTEMNNRDIINDFANKTVNEAPIQEVDTLYRMLNFLTDITETSRNSMHITENERHCLFRSLLETKQAIVKSISNDQKKLEIFLKGIHLPHPERN